MISSINNLMVLFLLLYIFIYLFLLLLFLQTARCAEECYWAQQRSEWEQCKQGVMSAFSQAGTDMLSVTLPVLVSTGTGKN